MEGEHDLQSKIDWCLSELRKAKSDNEKLAALRLVATATNCKDLTADTRTDLLSAIGTKFLTRLLKTKSAPEGCTVTQFKSIALSVLSGLCADPQMILKADIHRNLEVLNSILLSDPSEEDAEKKTMVDDSYEIISQLVATENGQNLLLSHNCISTLCQCIVETVYGSEKAKDLLKILLLRVGPRIWTGVGHGHDLQSILCHLTERFKLLQDASKFELCKFISLVIRSIPNTMIKKCTDSSWLRVLVHCLQEILTSKLGEAQREPTLKMTATLVDRLDVTSLLPPLTADSKLMLVVTHLSCIEVRMILENSSFEQVVKKSDLLCSCYQLLENIIGYMTTAPSLLLDEKQILQLHAAMVGAFNAIICFLKEISESEDSLKPDPVVIATVRVLGVWLSEETTALREGTCDILPFLLQLCKLQVTAMAGTQDEVAAVNNDINHTNHQTTDSVAKKSEENKSIEASMNACHIDLKQTSDKLLRTTDTSSDGDKDIEEKFSLSETESVTLGCENDSSNVLTEGVTGELVSKETRIPENEMAEANPCLNNENNSNYFQNSSVDNISDTQDNVSRKKTSSLGDARSDNQHGVIVVEDPCDVLSRIDLVRFLLPAFCHLTVEDRPRQIILSENSQTWLVRYLLLSMEKVQQHADDTAKRGVEVLCSVFLNLTVLEGPLVKNDPDLLQLCHFIMKVVPNYANKEDCLFMWANLVTLGLFLIRHQVTTNIASSEEKLKYFTTVMLFMKCPYTFRQQGQGHELSLTEMYASVWEDVSQLWQLTVQALCECLPLYPELQKALLSVGVLPYLIKLMIKVEGRQMKDDFRDGAFNLITAAAKSNPKAKEVIIDCKGSKLAQIYKNPAIGKLLE